ncbi:hypothetical protein Acr_03g0016960 [Actinidia rufa]|uniref:Uncharacterized protein n=1 Tax=Actinidia rufa TaxID=165716 RepID=A0A7J0EEZ9_9ERIC|nr:hypothetical protein Acr_03g0016960 [Actinidia rufa]
MHDDVQRQIETKSEISRTKSSLLGVKSKQNRVSPVSNKNSEEVADFATKERRFVGVRQGSAKLRRSQARRRSISSEPVNGSYVIDWTEARTASFPPHSSLCVGDIKQVHRKRKERELGRSRPRQPCRVVSCRHGYFTSNCRV